jgi:hypothetical protein
LLHSNPSDLGSRTKSHSTIPKRQAEAYPTEIQRHPSSTFGSKGIRRGAASENDACAPGATSVVSTNKERKNALFDFAGWRDRAALLCWHRPFGPQGKQDCLCY